jgi:transcriptional regulator with XRE-family HTH domain
MAAREALGRQLRAYREAAGYTQQELADQLGYSRPRVAGAEKGDGCALLFWQGCDKLLNAEGSLVAGFEEIEALRRKEASEAAAAARIERESRIRSQINDAYRPISDSGLAGFSGRSHKFIAAHIGSDVVDQVIEAGSMTPAARQWLECHSTEVGHSTGACNLYLWPFGTALFHLVEDLDMPSISTLAGWRIRSYEENLAWATSRLRHLTQVESVSASYVLSLYWIDSPRCESSKVDTALKVICSPRVLLRREIDNVVEQQEHSERVERSLLTNGFEHDGLKSFGLSGVSVGYASWSGVVYHPITPEQSLTEAEIVDCELAVQSVWAYSEHVNQQVEEGCDPAVSDKYGWRYLRGVKSRLVNPRPQETGQHRAMRNSIVETSDLIGHLDQAIDVIRQLQER